MKVGSLGTGRRSRVKYGVIYIDPPYWYNSRKNDGSTKFGGGAEGHYPLMRDKDVLALAPMIDELADENCALFLWATCPRLDFSIDLIRAFNFRYCTVAFSWQKTVQDGSKFIYGPGYYTGSNLEIVLLGVRGSMPPEVKMTQQDVVTPRGRHSAKPETVRQRIEAMYPTANKIELFARPPHPIGWDVWGLEANVVKTRVDCVHPTCPCGQIPCGQLELFA